MRSYLVLLGMLVVGCGGGEAATIMAGADADPTGASRGRDGGALGSESDTGPSAEQPPACRPPQYTPEQWAQLWPLLNSVELLWDPPSPTLEGANSGSVFRVQNVGRASARNLELAPLTDRQAGSDGVWLVSADGSGQSSVARCRDVTELKTCGSCTVSVAVASQNGKAGTYSLPVRLLFDDSGGTRRTSEVTVKVTLR